MFTWLRVCTVTSSLVGIGVVLVVVVCLGAAFARALVFASLRRAALARFGVIFGVGVAGVSTFAIARVVLALPTSPELAASDDFLCFGTFGVDTLGFAVAFVFGVAPVASVVRILAASGGFIRGVAFVSDVAAVGVGITGTLTCAGLRRPTLAGLRAPASGPE